MTEIEEPKRITELRAELSNGTFPWFGAADKVTMMGYINVLSGHVAILKNELTRIDRLLERRPAIDHLTTRYDKIVRALSVASTAQPAAPATKVMDWWQPLMPTIPDDQIAAALRHKLQKDRAIDRRVGDRRVIDDRREEGKGQQ